MCALSVLYMCCSTCVVYPYPCCLDAPPSVVSPPLDLPTLLCRLLNAFFVCKTCPRECSGATVLSVCTCTCTAMLACCVCVCVCACVCELVACSSATGEVQRGMLFIAVTDKEFLAQLDRHVCLVSPCGLFSQGANSLAVPITRSFWLHPASQAHSSRTIALCCVVCI